MEGDNGNGIPYYCINRRNDCSTNGAVALKSLAFTSIRKRERKHKGGERMGDKDDWIEIQNKKITHLLWIIFVSMITSIITTLLYTA